MGSIWRAKISLFDLDLWIGSFSQAYFFPLSFWNFCSLFFLVFFLIFNFWSVFLFKFPSNLNVVWFLISSYYFFTNITNNINPEKLMRDILVCQPAHQIRHKYGQRAEKIIKKLLGFLFTFFAKWQISNCSKDFYF